MAAEVVPEGVGVAVPDVVAEPVAPAVGAADGSVHA